MYVCILVYVMFAFEDNNSLVLYVFLPNEFEISIIINIGQHLCLVYLLILFGSIFVLASDDSLKNHKILLKLLRMNFLNNFYRVKIFIYHLQR